MFKKLKSIFIVEDESAKKAEPTPSKKTSPAKKNAPASKAKSSGPVPKSTGGKPAEKFVDKLLTAIEANNLEGFDYLEFKQSLQSLGTVDMDEKTRMQSAMAMAKTMGATEDKIINAAQHYLNILKEEQEKFEVAFKAQEVKQINARESGIKNAEASIKEKQQQIEKLNAEIKALNEKLANAKKEANQASAKVQTTKDGFYNAYHSVVNQIKSDISSMQKHLK